MEPIQLAINYSAEAAQLFKDGQIHPDRFKTPDWPKMISEASQLRPVAVHFGINAGRGQLEARNWAASRELMDATGTPFVNLHLNPVVDDYPDIPVDTTDLKHVELITDRLLQDVAVAVDQIGAGRVILENVPYRGKRGNTIRPAVLPQVISRIIQESGCGLLLDLSHARIAACYLGMDVVQYLEALPTQHLREMHFTGLHWVNGMLKDHLSALPQDWLMLEWALKRVRHGDWSPPWLLAFEYGGVGEKFQGRSDPVVIQAQMPIIVNMIIMP